MRHRGIADRSLPRSYTMQKISRMTVAAIQVRLIGSQRLLHDLGRVRHQRIPVHRDPPARSDKTRAPFSANRFTWISFAIHHDTTLVLVAGASLFHPDF